MKSKLLRKLFRRKTLPTFGSYGKNNSISYDLSCNNPQNIFIGNNNQIGSHSHFVVILNYQEQSLDGRIVIGDNCLFTGSIRITSAKSITIGNNVLIGPNVSIYDCNHGFDPNKEDYINQPITYKEVVICNSCFIGERSVILPGVTIGEKAVVGAGSIVTKDVPPFSMVAGNPAKIIKIFNKDINKWVKYN